MFVHFYFQIGSASLYNNGMRKCNITFLSFAITLVGFPKIKDYRNES